MLSKLRSLLPAWVTIPILLAAAGAAVVVVGECNAFRRATLERSEPYVAPPAPAEERAEVKVLPCREIQAIEPTPRDRRRLAERYNRPDLSAEATARAFELGLNAAEIVGEKELEPMPAGGTVLVTLEPDGRVVVTADPAPEKLIAWGATWELGAMAGLDSEQETRGRAWAAVEPIRFGRIHLRGELGADVRAGVTDGYAMVGAVWRSK